MVINDFLEKAVKGDMVLFHHIDYYDDQVEIPDLGFLYNKGICSCVIEPSSIYQEELKSLGLKNPLLFCTREDFKKELLLQILGKDRVKELNKEGKLFKYLNDLSQGMSIDFFVVEKGKDIDISYEEGDQIVMFREILDENLSLHTIQLESPEDVYREFDKLLNLTEKENLPFVKNLLLKAEETIIKGVEVIFNKGYTDLLWDLHGGQFISFEGEQNIYCIDPVMVNY